MELDIDLAEQSTSNNLPDETQDEMLPAFLKVLGSNIYDGTTNSLGGGDNDVVVLGHLESVKWLSGGRLVEDTHIDSVRNGVVNQFAKDETITALVEELHGACWYREAITDVAVSLEHSIDVIRKLRTFVFVESMADVGGGPLDGDLAGLCC